MDPTMVIFAAIHILLTHICSAFYLMPREQLWGSNAFSPCQKLPFSGKQKLENFSAGCWHTTHFISLVFPSNRLCNCPRKCVRFKSHQSSTIPTSRDLLVPLVLATSGFLSTSIVGAASGGSNSNLEGPVHSSSFAPPGGHPTCTGKTPTKTQAAAN
jgi:hypothetical protein